MSQLTEVTTAPEATVAPAELVGPLERGLAVLRAVAAGPGTRHRPGDLVRATGLARSTVDRVATTLVRLGFLRTEDRDLLLAPRSAELGNAYLAGCALLETLRPHAVTLADELDESVSLAVPDGDGVRFIAQAARRRAMAISFRVAICCPPNAARPAPCSPPTGTTHSTTSGARGVGATRWTPASRPCRPARPGRSPRPQRWRPTSSTGYGRHARTASRWTAS
ncbi:helix-turn-helix domain-containing protein [Streptomyces sp. NPDC002596]